MNAQSLGVMWIHHHSRHHGRTTTPVGVSPKGVRVWIRGWGIRWRSTWEVPVVDRSSRIDEGLVVVMVVRHHLRRRGEHCMTWLLWMKGSIIEASIVVGTTIATVVSRADGWGGEWRGHDLMRMVKGVLLVWIWWGREEGVHDVTHDSMTIVVDSVHTSSSWCLRSGAHPIPRHDVAQRG